MLFNTCLSVGNIGILKSPTFIMLGLIYIFIYNNVFNKIGDTQKKLIPYLIYKNFNARTQTVKSKTA